MKNNLIIVILMSSVITFGCVDKSGKKQSKKAPEIIEKSNKPIEAFLKREDCTLAFDKFFDRFAKDSVFQKSRVKFPLKFSSSYYDFNTRKDTIEVSFISTVNDFESIDFSGDENAMDNEYDKYTVHIESSDSIVNYKLSGYDNGLRLNYKFKLVDGCWYLVAIIDQSI